MKSQLPKLPPEIESLKPYVPGKPIEELERELGIKNAIKMASNENPLGPSPKAAEAIARALKNLHRYPDGAAFELCRALAQKYGVDQSQVVVGNGSDEIIEFICRAYIRPGQEAVCADPSFLMYSKLVQVAGGVLREVPLKGFEIDLEAILEAITPATRLVIINSPNNPAGTAVSKAGLRDFLDRTPKGILVVLDEAYIEFVSDPQAANGADFLGHDTPILVMRTFSKAYGLAGLRIGYGLGHPEVIRAFDRVRQPFNTSIPAQVGALAALGDEDFLARTQKLVRDGLEQLYAGFDKLGLSYIPTQTNFVLLKVGDNAADYADRLLRRGVIIRGMASYKLPEYLRISVGKAEENQKLLTELAGILGKD